MRTLTAIVFVALLSGCSVFKMGYDAATMAKFDNNEYLLAGRISATADLGMNYCDHPDVVRYYANDIWLTSKELKLYADNRNENKDVQELTTALHDIAKGVGEKYMKYSIAGEEAPSTGYCKLKMKSLISNGAKIQEAIGDKEL